MSTARVWRCVVCGYLHEGPEPPEECPVCGAGRDEFEPVGAAAAARETAPDAEIALVNGEPDLPYYRINLTRLLAAEIAESELPLYPADWYEAQGIRLLSGRRAAALHPDRRSVTMEDGEELAADRIVLATGARPFVPPIRGAEREGALALRTRADAAAALAAARAGARILFIGGGILALEAAAGLRRRGAETTLLEHADRLLARQLNARAARALERRAAAAGVRTIVNARVKSIVGARRAEGVELEDGRVLPADAVIIAAGVRPDAALAQTAGLKVERGIVVDDRLATSAEGVYAAGDAAEHRGALYGLWDPARFQGRIAGWNAMGRAADFGGLPPTATLKVLGVKLVSIGDVREAAGLRVLESETDEVYRAFFFRGRALAGAILLGDTSAAAGARRAIETAADLGTWLDHRTDAASVAARLANG